MSLGAEGSGTTFISKCLVMHPKITQPDYDNFDGSFPLKNDINHITVPRGDYYWVDISNLVDYKLVIVMRNLIDSIHSTYRRFYKPGMSNYALIDQMKAYRFIQKIIMDPTIKDFHIIHYEKIELNSLND